MKKKYSLLGSVFCISILTLLRSWQNDKISVEMAELLHQLIAEETGGEIGVRDEGLLDSALESAFATFDGKDLYPTIVEVCFAV